jgi:hypothetical protein
MKRRWTIRKRKKRHKEIRKGERIGWKTEREEGIKEEKKKQRTAGAPCYLQNPKLLYESRYFLRKDINNREISSLSYSTSTVSYEEYLTRQR